MEVPRSRSTESAAGSTDGERTSPREQGGDRCTPRPCLRVAAAAVPPRAPTEASHAAGAQRRWRSISTAAQVTAPTAAHMHIASRKSITVAPVAPEFADASCPGVFYPNLPTQHTSCDARLVASRTPATEAAHPLTIGCDFSTKRLVDDQVRISVESEGATTRVRLGGEIDLQTSPAVRACLDQF